MSGSGWRQRLPRLLSSKLDSLTCKKVKHTHTQGRSEAAAQAGTDANEAAEENQGQWRQGKQKLTPP